MRPSGIMFLGCPSICVCVCVCLHLGRGILRPALLSVLVLEPECCLISTQVWSLSMFRSSLDSVLLNRFHTHTYTQPFNGPLSGTTRVGQYQKKHSPTHTLPDHRTSFIIFLHLLRSIASSLFNLRAWQSSSTTSLQVLFGLPLGLGPSASYSMHFFTQSSSSSFCNTCPYHRDLFCC